MIRKLYREKVALNWDIIEKETIDEIIIDKQKNKGKMESSIRLTLAKEHQESTIDRNSSTNPSLNNQKVDLFG